MITKDIDIFHLANIKEYPTSLYKVSEELKQLDLQSLYLTEPDCYFFYLLIQKFCLMCTLFTCAWV